MQDKDRLLDLTMHALMVAHKIHTDTIKICTYTIHEADNLLYWYDVSYLSLY